MRFIVITLPPAEIIRVITELRQPWNELVGAQEALRYPPHITLRTGLVCPDDQAETVAQAFLDHARRFSGFQVRTEGLFYTTYGPPHALKGMVGWAVHLDQPLRQLHLGLLEYTSWQKGPQGEFHPHVSLCYGDLKPEDVDKLKVGLEALRPPVPDFTWTLDHVALYYETPEGWGEWAKRPLLNSHSNLTESGGKLTSS